ncbi:MAG TPA: ATPase [Fervidicoccus fontis]|uniref:ATPase n=1 Tax=Fervidicoccus fontis TaxID=683846 RepID=A0A7C2Z4J2_9CREN|nr:ATPase [Fervidicoccus fontis]
MRFLEVDRLPKLISTGNEELDVKLQGGLPFPNLILIEGPHGSSKSVFLQQLLFGALKSGLRAVVITTETTSTDYLRKMKNISLDVRDFIIKAKLRIYSLQIAERGWGGELERVVLRKMLELMKKGSLAFDFLLVDSLTHILSPLTEKETLTLFSEARRLSSEECMLAFSLHPNTLDERVMTKFRALSDSYIKLSIATLGGRTVKVMEIVKLRGAPTTFESTITFDVDPAFGMKLVPIALARS